MTKSQMLEKLLVMQREIYDMRREMDDRVTHVRIEDHPGGCYQLAQLVGALNLLSANLDHVRREMATRCLDLHRTEDRR